MELDIVPCGVSCTAVLPGGVKTNIARRARIDASVAALTGEHRGPEEFDRIALTGPTRAARQILGGVEQNRRHVLIGPDARAIDLISRLPAGLYQQAVVRGARRRRPGPA
jgi:short-subunit dehydrogenase